MKKIYLLIDADWLQEIETNLKDLRKSFYKNAKNRWYWLKAKKYLAYEISYDDKRFDYDWQHWDFRIYEKDLTDIDNMEHIIDRDDYSDYGIIKKELKKDFLYLKIINRW